MSGRRGSTNGATWPASGVSLTVMIRLVLSLLFVCLATAPGFAQSWSANAQARVCPADPGETAPPDFSSPACHSQPFWSVDTQGRTVWIEAIIALDAAPEPVSGPYGLFLSGKMAAQAWLNGQRLGSNGAPGFSRGAETPGVMDSVLFVPAGVLRTEENRVVLLASGHHSLIQLGAPVHRIAVGRYGDPRQPFLQGYQGALITLGVFTMALAFFASLAVRSEHRAAPVLLAAIALSAGLQLMAEAGRGLFAYAYPVHDLRLIALAAGAAVLALLTTMWSVHRFGGGRFQRALIALLALALIPILIFAPGFDGKTAFTLLAGALGAGLPPLLHAVRQRAPASGLWAAGFAVFATSLWLAPASFLDRTVFWALSALLLVAMVDEARRFTRERSRRLDETRRADALASALARAEQANPDVTLPLISAGRTDYAPAHSIARLNAAGDYVEVVFKDGRSLLHTGALAQLEERLPASFLRVHRSCIVNTDEIAALERDANGSGRLILKTAGEAPVSRRILPAVKAALTGPGAAG